MDTLRRKISELFNNSKPKGEEVQRQPKPIESKKEELTLKPISSGDLPVPEIKMKKFTTTTEPSVPNFSYELEFVDFIDRNSPKGLSRKFMELLPYMEISLFSWPAFWLYRGYNWQRMRNTERINVYIQRTYQQAKLMQMAILATGVLAISMSRSPFQVQKMEYKKPNESS